MPAVGDRAATIRRPVSAPNGVIVPTPTAPREAVARARGRSSDPDFGRVSTATTRPASDPSPHLFDG